MVLSEQEYWSFFSTQDLTWWDNFYIRLKFHTFKANWTVNMNWYSLCPMIRTFGKTEEIALNINTYICLCAVYCMSLLMSLCSVIMILSITCRSTFEALMRLWLLVLLFPYLLQHLFSRYFRSTDLNSWSSFSCGLLSALCRSFETVFVAVSIHIFLLFLFLVQFVP